MSWIIFTIGGCTGGNSALVTSDSPAANKGLTFSITPTLQLDVGSSSFMSALLINNTDKKVDTISFQSDNSNLVVLDTECDSLEPGASCKVDLKLSVEADAGGYLLKAFAKDENSKEYHSQQLFSYTSLHQESMPINQLSLVKNKIVSMSGETFALAIPFNKKIAGEEVSSSLSGMNDIISKEIVCGNSDKTQCTFIALGKSSDSGIISVRLSANNEVFYTTNLNILAASRGNLVSSSSNLIVSPANGESSTSFTLLNNGSESISGIRMFPTNNPAFESRVTYAGNCSGTLDAGASCMMQVKVNASGLPNGKLAMSVSYNTTLKNDGTSQTITDKISLWLYYLNTDAIPAISITSADFTNNLYESTAKYIINRTFTVTNTGNVALANLKLSKLIYLNTSFNVDSNSSCSLLSSLLPNQTCLFKITYNSTLVGYGYIKAQASATYNDSNGLIRTIVSNINTSYFNTNGNFAYFGRNKDSTIKGVDFCQLLDTKGAIGNCQTKGSTNSQLGTGDSPFVVYPMFSPDATSPFLYIFNSYGKGSLTQCSISKESGEIRTCNQVQSYSNLSANSVNARSIIQQGLYDPTTNKFKFYIYAGSRLDGITADKDIGVIPITESGAITNTTNGYSFEAPINDPTALMFEESKIYMFGNKNAKVCTIDSSTGAIVTNSCSDISGNLSDIFSSARFLSVSTIVVNNNGTKTRYVYLSDLGSDDGNQNNVGRVFRCTIEKSATTGDLSFTNCSTVLTGLNRLRGLEIVSFESGNYLYYTDSTKNTNGLFSYEILPNGDLANLNTQQAAIFKSGGNDQMGVLRTPSAYFKYDKTNYTVKAGQSFAMKIDFVGNGTIGSTRLSFGNSSVPSQITINGQRLTNFLSDFAVESGFDSKSIIVNVNASVGVGSYTVRGVTNNGIVVPDITITVVK